MIELDEALAARIGAVVAGRNAAGDVVGVTPLTYGRGRIIRGDEWGVSDYW